MTNLRSVIKEEHNLTVKMGALVFALEAVSDVHIEYSNFNLLVDSLALVYSMLENQVSDLQNQRVSREQLPVNKLVEAVDVSSLMSVKVTVNIHSGGYSIVYTVPEVAEIFVLKYVKVLPILL
jgi:hypothetical protein